MHSAYLQLIFAQGRFPCKYNSKQYRHILPVRSAGWIHVRLAAGMKTALSVAHSLCVVSPPTVLSQVEPSPVAFGGGGRQALNRLCY